MSLERKADTVLAGRVGRYAEAAPAPPLRAHFLCLWTHRIPEDHTATIAVVPDGCVDLLWHEGGLAVVGPDVTAAHPDLRPGTTVLGLRFRPGVAARWLGLPLDEIVGSAVGLPDIWGPRAVEMTDRLAEIASVEEQAVLLQRMLVRMAASIETPNREAAVMFETLQGTAGGEGAGLMRLRRSLELSERTLRRRCHHLFGYGPKTLDRILRFQKVLSAARRKESAGLAALAYATGYADQAHLSREIHALSGMTAREFVRQLSS
jgi:AraC-like DNA-binding protein